PLKAAGEQLLGLGCSVKGLQCSPPPPPPPPPPPRTLLLPGHIQGPKRCWK
ncbi:Hypothetical predicted protein, partial [Podarcis lilfordi]